MRAGLLIALVACAPAPPVPVAHNVEPGPPRVAVPETQQLGWVGLAPLATRDGGSWLPAGPATVYLPSPRPEITAQTTLLALDTAGTTTAVKTTGTASIPYGCDSNQLEATALDSLDKTRLAPGPVWLLPPDMPAVWAPKPLRIEAAPPRPAARQYRAGPLVIDLARTATAKGRLTIAWHGLVVYTAPFERGAMAGGDTAPIDLVAGGPGVVEPVAAWAILGLRAPILVVLREPTYEGLNLRVVLVDETAAASREIESMGFYLYHCAF